MPNTNKPQTFDGVAAMQQVAFRNQEVRKLAEEQPYKLFTQAELDAAVEQARKEARIDEVNHFSDNIADWSKLSTAACLQLANARDIRIAHLTQQGDSNKDEL